MVNVNRRWLKRISILFHNSEVAVSTQSTYLIEKHLLQLGKN